MNKFLENSEKLSDGRYRLHENHILTKETIVEEIPVSSNTLIEAEGKEYPVTKKYVMKVWEQSSSNKNGRQYDRVFERILNENHVTLGLVDHPKGDEDGNPKDIYAVQSNPHMRDGWLCIEQSFVGDYGRLAEEILEKGGFISISSSCLGQVDHEGYVMQEGFELERYGDWVMNPSNGVKHFANESISENSIKESTPKENVTISNIDDNSIKKNENKEKNVMDTNKLIEQSLLTNIKSLIKESKKIENLPERIAYLKEDVIPSFGDIDSANLNTLKESVVSEITSLEKSVAENLSTLEESSVQKDEEISALKESNEALTAKADRYKTIIEELRKQLAISKKLVEKQSDSELEEKLAIMERDNQELMAKLLEAEDEEDEEEDSEEGEEEDSEEDMDEKNKKKESVVKDTEKETQEDKTNKIREYYEDMVKTHPEISKIKSAVKRSESLEEAQTLILKYIDKLEESAESKSEEETKVKESVSTPVVKSVAQVLQERKKQIGK